MLTDEEGSYFRDMESLFNHPGWARLTNEIKEAIDGVPEQTFWNVATLEELVAQRIRLQERTVLLLYPEAVERRKESLIAARVQAVADAAEGERE